jgi:hypothetical protein
MSAPYYQLIDISKKNNEYLVALTLANKDTVINLKLTEILVNNELMEKLSSNDIKTLVGFNRKKTNEK